LLNLAAELAPSCSLKDDAGGGEVRDRLKECLEELSDSGDLVSLANGHWLPAPTREVVLGTRDGVRLLVGGLPSSLLPSNLAIEIQNHGPFRRTKGKLLGSELGLISESCDSWVGGIPRDLLEWTKGAFEGRYDAYNDSGEGRFYFYAPELARPGTPQGLRWVDKADRVSGRVLARRDLPFGLRQFRAAELVQGRIKGLMIPRLAGGDLRRLMYGLDALAGNPVAVQREQSTSGIKIVLGSELPRPERRFFAALGELSVPADKYYPRTWRFSSEHGVEINSRLHDLGVRLVEKLETRSKR
jgi:hypothetical protein